MMTIRRLIGPSRSFEHLLELVTPAADRFLVRLEAVAARGETLVETLYERSAAQALRALDRDLERAVFSASVRLPNLLEVEDVRYALYELRPARLSAALEYLRADNGERVGRLLQFVRVLRTMASARIAEASTPEDVSDAVVGALDDLQRYLVAHDLVESAYRRSMGDRTSELLLWMTRTYSQRQIHHNQATWCLAHGPARRMHPSDMRPGRPRALQA
jgi:hypothetical protein